MEQGTHINHLQTSIPDFFGDEELVIGEILRCFPELVLECDLRKWVLFNKRNRSKRRRTGINWSPESPLNYLWKNHEDEREKAREPKFIGKASSPDTPLNLFASEKSEDSLGKISMKRPHFSLENHQVKLINSINASENQDEHEVHCMVHYQPYAVDPTVDGPQTSETFQHPCAQISPVLPSGSGSGKAHDMGPLGIDLNVPAEEAFGVDYLQPLDQSRALADKRAIAAEARSSRMLKIRARKDPLAIKP